MFSIYIIGRLNIHLQGPSCEEVGNRTSQPPTTSQHHVLALSDLQLHECKSTHTHTHSSLAADSTQHGTSYQRCHQTSDTHFSRLLIAYLLHWRNAFSD